MTATLDQILEQKGTKSIISHKDIRLIQLVNLKLVSIQIVGLDKYNVQETTLGTKGESYQNLDLNGVIHRIEVLSITAKNGSFSKKWYIEDVHSVQAGLTDIQAEKALIHAIRTHDANIGINWEVLEECAKCVLEEAI